MIRTDTLDYETRKKKFLEYKDTLEKVPTDPDAKKEYYVGCHSAEDWQYIHEVLMQDGTLEDNIPDHCCECCNDCKYAPRRGIYLLSDSEAEELKNHPRVRYVNINAARYPGTFMDNPDDLSEATKTYRYASTVKHQRSPKFAAPDGSGPTLPNTGIATVNYAGALVSISTTTPSSDLQNRGGYQLKRHMQKADPWFSVINDGSGSNTTIFDDRIQQHGDGSDVDIIVCDQEMWFGHIEFQNHLGGPTEYRGGNVLPGNGTCDILDLLLDSPYYIDPEFFDANPSKLMRRWDGTIVPTEEGAYNWWKNNSTSHRSAKFVSTSNGGTATGDNDFGTVQYNLGYTRAVCNGSNTEYQVGENTHGTPCASQAYGRQYGWAYNANKWFLNMYGTNSNGHELGFAVQRIFHQIKPINPAYGTKDPTISSNSWSHKAALPSEGTDQYYWFRPSATDGSVSGTYFSSSRPQFLDNFRSDAYQAVYDTDNSIVEAGEELCDSGVIFVHAAGNQNQKQVHSDHPDYNNYYASSNYTSLDNAKTTESGGQMSGIQYSHAVNRRGFPGQIGIITSSSPYTYKTISVGALYNLYNSIYTSSKEGRAYYSNSGEAVDVFAAAEETIAASDSETLADFNILSQLITVAYGRYDQTYTLPDSNSTSKPCYDRLFSGTSSACPIFAGLLATKMQYNRSWTYSDVRSWIVGLGAMPSSDFWYGTEATTANDSNWDQFKFSMQGNPGYVVWDKPTGNEPNNAFGQSVDDTTPTEGNAVEITITTDASNGTYYYTTEVGTASTISASDFDSNSLTGSFNIVSGIGTISLGITTDSTEELIRESFRIRVRTGTGIGDTILATSDYITIDDADIPSVTFTTTPTSIDDDSTGTFEISASSFSDGTNLYWDVSSPSDFETSSGIVTVSSGVGTVTVTTVRDYLTEGSETFNLRVRSQPGGQILATSNNVTLNDTSFNISYRWLSYPTRIAVGQTGTYRAVATNGAGKTVLINHWRSGFISYDDYEVEPLIPVPGGHSLACIADSNGVITWKMTINEEFDPEGQYTEAYHGMEFEILDHCIYNCTIGSYWSNKVLSKFIPGRYNGDWSGVVVGVATTTPTYAINPAWISVNEGASLTIDVETVNVGSGTTLYWDVTNPGDFSTSNGSFIISNNAGSFSVTPTADSTTEGSETFKVTVYTDSARTAGVQTSQILTITDIIPLDNIKFMSGSGLTFSGSVRIVMK